MNRKSCLIPALLFFGALFILDALFATDLLKGLFTIGFHLFLGSIMHAVASFPYAFGSLSHALWTLGILLGAFFVLHGLLILLNSKSGRWKLPQSARAFAMALLLLGGGAAAIQAARTAVLLTTQDNILTSGRDYVSKSISNGRQLVTAMRIYASEHDGNYPDQVEELIAADILEPGSLVNLNWVYLSGEVPAPWIFLRGLRNDAPGNLPMFVSPHPVTRNKYIIAYNDSSVSLQTATEREAAIHRWREYRKQSSSTEAVAP
ncbi:hypothetical protein [Verrucomicrobium sp. BvORR106]|uniref:hypothetical protein n=1 Tax=Verrucomicrobium sp. BvORR106 TaxID=1403819 RepID=UPI00056F1695|nr:hypothetical protein [Verrucomicrobium sp. BvORR106]